MFQHYIFSIFEFRIKQNYVRNFHPLEVVDRASERQLRVGENLNKITRRSKG